MTLVVGQKLWYVPWRGRPYEIAIEKVGRKWALVEGRWPQRINIETLDADGGGYSSPGRAHVSREEYEKLAADRKAWTDFKLSVYKFNGVSPISADRIAEIRAELGL